jgi:predicted phage terminase large subunit-like protein
VIGPSDAAYAASLVDRLAALPPEDRRAIFSELPDDVCAQALYTWELWARPDQLPPPGEWRVWLLRSGRGAGKTRTGAEWVRKHIEAGTYRRVALVGRTWADVRDVMVEGESGILAVSKPWVYPAYEPSRRRLVWPNGAIAKLYSAEEPDLLRGPQHDAAWCDELASWRAPETWDNLMMGLRLGTDPRCVVTTTPRPTKLIRTLIAKKTTVETRASTYANRANLAAAFFDDIVSVYEGTRLGRQEIYGELLEDVPGALWSHARIDEARLSEAPRNLTRVVVAVDPAVSSGENSDETGICVVALGEDKHGYVLADRSGRYSPHRWGELVIKLYHDYEANHVVAEGNNGGEIVKDLLQAIDSGVPVRMVHASRGKFVRAEPISSLYEQGRVHHVGSFPELEDQMASFTPDLDRTTQGSPDRVDALVWGLSEVMLQWVTHTAGSIKYA